MSLTAKDMQQLSTMMTGVVNDALAKFEVRFEAKLDKKLDEKLDKKLEEKFTEKLKDYPTKADLAREFEIRLAKFATKDDLDRMESRIVASMGLIERDAFARLDQHEERLQKLEKACFS